MLSSSSALLLFISDHAPLFIPDDVFHDSLDEQSAVFTGVYVLEIGILWV